MAKVRKYFSAATAEVLVHSFVSSELDFFFSLLYGLLKYEIKLAYVSLIMFAILLRSCTGYLPVEQRIVFKINLTCFKVLNNLVSSYLVELLCVYEPARRLLSFSDKWRFAIEPYNLKTYGFRAFSVIAPDSGKICPLILDRSTM